MTRRVRPALLALATFAGLATAAQAEVAQGFKSPSGNIHCLYDEGSKEFPASLRCDIVKTSNRKPKAPKDCPLDYGNAFELKTSGRGEFLCYSDTILGADYKVLPYGQTWTQGGLTCFSAESGVTCRNSAGGGLELSRARQRVF